MKILPFSSKKPSALQDILGHISTFKHLKYSN